MEYVIYSALGIGGATILGVFLGFFFKSISHAMQDMILGFASGIMLAAAILGLILPSLEFGNLWLVVSGIFAGAFLLNIIDRLTPHIHHLTGDDQEKHQNNSDLMNKTLLFVIAIAIHNIPEGIATGVSFGTGNLTDAFTVAIGIALQNIPEGMIVVIPLLVSCMSKKRTFIISAFTGIVEILATFLGYFAISISTAILPFLLALAGGTMLYIISDEMIPETHDHGHEQLATYAILTGFCLMLIIETLL
ncbi:MAG: ZIP family metal transporter [Erysipelotrichaceae bacterium]|nr:ZIP family metal transporter [Erysipelotrichaceae bacterium]